MARLGALRTRGALLGAGSAVVVLGAAGAAVFGFGSSASQPRPVGCSVNSPSGHFALDLAQASNAATISAVGLRQGLPDHAVTIAIAAALQESKLHNVPYGDRDSVGLFQQRPSEGWGARADLLDPEYAATQFFSHLAQVPGWETDSVAVAAQAVQHSADGSAYENWEGPARAVAEALTGEAPAAVTCSFTRAVSSSAGLSTAMSAQLPAMPGTTVSGKIGWTIASWLVAQAAQYDIVSVTFHGQQWTPGTGQWQRTRSGGNESAVEYRLGRGSS